MTKPIATARVLPGAKDAATGAPEVVVPYVDLAGQHASLKSELLDAVARVIDRGQFVLGEEVQQFEQEFADLCGVPYAVGVNSGTDALILALRVLGIGPGDEVITAPNSFIASAACIALTGARPVFADVDDDYNLSVERVAAAITPRTRAILPVHLTGRPCDMNGIRRIAAWHRLHIIEDCAQAVAADYQGRAVGSLGDIGCFSLHPLKTLNACGDGGVLTTADPEIYKQLLVMRNLGMRTRDDWTVWSGNSRLDTVQAAMLLVKLPRLRAWTETRRENARYYRTQLVSVNGVRIPADRPGVRAVYHTFVIRAERRDELRAYLEANGIGTAVHYPIPIHLSPAARELGYAAGSLPEAERQAHEILSLPISPELSAAQRDRVCEAISAFYAS